MENYTKGIVFKIGRENQEKEFAIIDTTVVEQENYFLAVPIDQVGIQANIHPEGVVAFKVNEDNSISIETEERIVSQIVSNILEQANA